MLSFDEHRFFPIAQIILGELPGTVVRYFHYPLLVKDVLHTHVVRWRSVKNDHSKTGANFIVKYI
jgi:hypothetical protein